MADLTPGNIDHALNRLRACRTIEQVNAAARELGPFVQDLAEDPIHYPRAHHIRNLAAYRRLSIRKGWT
ncbi:hypothetical protein DVVG_00041 [Dunaliella viridis virus SI2]|uniref:hypothetical protein n=1 Tax=Dunaliella viridis virus SI2 TaxID=754069 RepID=UPI0002C0DD2D|nr:hypothetical protein DVVG_00041 [Dunaliella viridis virus SI2]AGH16027.1 hypothetical protein DVVG_00041 [Dunaliella viridis virus SI2]